MSDVERAQIDCYVFLSLVCFSKFLNCFSIDHNKRSAHFFVRENKNLKYYTLGGLWRWVEFRLIFLIGYFVFFMAGLVHAVLEGPVIFRACLWENKLLEQRGNKFLTAD